MMKCLRKITLILPALLFALPIVGCSNEEPVGPPNIVVISIDGLRSDFLTPERMPLVCEFATKHCHLFENARANSTWGTPSHVTMLTGLLQSEHGVEYEDSSIPIEIAMIQEKLQKSGYTTTAFVSGDDFGADVGFERGFDAFHNVGMEHGEAESGNETFAQRLGGRMVSIDEAEHFLNSHPAQPLFLYIQTSAVKDYWLDAFPHDARISEEIERSWREEELPKAEQPLWERFKAETSTDRKRYLYSAAVRELDRRLGDFLMLLEHSSVFPETKLIITSAHGEGLGDAHGEYLSYGHTASPYSDQINVPLVVYGLDTGRSDRLVGLDDIAGTVLAFAGIEVEPAKSLFRHRERVISEYIAKDGSDGSRAAAYMTATRKFLLSADHRLHVYMDPLDADDLIRLRHATIQKGEITEELKEQLSALGYIQR